MGRFSTDMMVRQMIDAGLVESPRFILPLDSSESMNHGISNES